MKHPKTDLFVFRHELEFTPLEFETKEKAEYDKTAVALEFTPLEFETNSTPVVVFNKFVH